MNIKGKVRFIQEFHYSLRSNKKINKEYDAIHQIFYNNNCQKIEETYLYPDGSLNYKWVFKYDENGNEIEWSQYDPDDLLDIRMTQKFDGNNNMIEFRIFYNDSKAEDIKEFIYDDKGNLIEEIWYDEKGCIDRKTIYRIDESGNVEEKVFDKNSTLQYFWIRRYDERQNEISRTGYNCDGTEYRHITQKYDDSGNITEEKWYSNPERMLFINKIYKYDKIGNLVEERHNKDIIVYQYDYDVNDNWIRFITLKNKIPQSVLIREIEYFA